MLSTTKRFLIAGTLMLGATLGISTNATAQDWTRTFTVVNGSHIRIDHLYVTPNTYSRWGYDRLGRYVLQPGYRYDVSVVPGWYDVKLVDKDGDECIVPSVDFRRGETWTITDGILLYCEGFLGM